MVVNDVRGLKLEFHILQSFPVTCLNRDDVGAPKTAVVGGTLRARVSSQSWKRAVRMMMRQLMGNDSPHIGKRTRYISSLIAKRCKELGATDDQAIACGEAVANLLSSGKGSKKDGKTDTLLFISLSEVERICQYLKEHQFSSESISNKSIKEILEIDSKRRMAIDAYDIALFGRMVAVEPILNIEGATAFSHAISTHRVSNEIDFFTAVDDEVQEMEEELGSGHMGVLEYNSATYYRYVGVNITQLYETLGENKDMVLDALEKFIKALLLALPSGKQATMSGLSGWEYARIYLRRGQGLQVMFDKAIKPEVDGGYLVPSKEFLREYLDKKETLYGSLFGKISVWDFGEEGSNSIDELIREILSVIGENL